MATEGPSWYMICYSLFHIQDAIIPPDDNSIFFNSVCCRCWYLDRGREQWKSALSVYFMRYGGNFQQFNFQILYTFTFSIIWLSSMAKCMVICVNSYVCLQTGQSNSVFYVQIQKILESTWLHIQLNFNFIKSCSYILFIFLTWISLE